MNDLEELKSLLFGAEKQALESIQERVQKPETRAVDVADVLPEAVRLSHRDGTELVKTLRDPVGQCLRESFHESPQDYADALYPVMGPAIRKSITHTLRALVQQINQTVDQSLSARGIKWRFEAWRAGVPFGEMVIQKTLLYRIEQAYLISRENGLLVSHVHHDASRIKDSDAVSAMFTAIQDFVKESFSPDRSGRLETADMGEFTLWAVHGPHALLVCVIRGVPPKNLRTDLSSILERIHFRYGEHIRNYAGDTSTMQGVEEELRDCLRLQAHQPIDSKRRRWSTPLLIILLVIVAALIYFGVTNWQLNQQQERLGRAFDETPGYYVAAIERDGRRFSVRGLRDPMAISIDEVAAQADVSRENMETHLQPFQSLDAEMVFLRVRDALNPPDSISVRVLDGTFVLAGSAPQDWIDSVRRQFNFTNTGWRVNVDAVESVELRQLQMDVEAVGKQEFFFAGDTTLRDADAEELRQYAAAIAELARTAEELGAELRVSVDSFTDSSGSRQENAELAGRRARLAEQYIIAAGVDSGLVSRSMHVPDAEFGAINPELRRVSLNLRLNKTRETDIDSME